MFGKLLAGLDEGLELPNLRTMKLRHAELSDVSVKSVIRLCPNLRRLDLSFTLVRRPFSLVTSQMPPLEKLALTSTAVTTVDLLPALRLLPHLKTLSLGALCVSPGATVSISNAALNDAILRELTDILETRHIENLSLVKNVKLGFLAGKDNALRNFISRVGRKCKWLDLSELPSLRSSDLEGLMAPPGDSPGLTTLILNNTAVDDDAAPFLASCVSLVTLQLAGTKVTSDGLFPILDSCTKLENLDLTSCRGVPVRDRRRFFEIWETARHNPDT